MVHVVVFDRIGVLWVLGILVFIWRRNRHITTHQLLEVFDFFGSGNLGSGREHEVWIRYDCWHFLTFFALFDCLLHLLIKLIILKLVLQFHSRYVEYVLPHPIYRIINSSASDDHAFGNIQIEASVSQLLQSWLLWLLF